MHRGKRRSKHAHAGAHGTGPSLSAKSKGRRGTLALANAPSDRPWITAPRPHRHRRRSPHRPRALRSRRNHAHQASTDISGAGSHRDRVAIDVRPRAVPLTRASVIAAPGRSAALRQQLHKLGTAVTSLPARTTRSHGHVMRSCKQQSRVRIRGHRVGGAANPAAQCGSSRPKNSHQQNEEASTGQARWRGFRESRDGRGRPPAGNEIGYFGTGEAPPRAPCRAAAGERRGPLDGASSLGRTPGA